MGTRGYLVFQYKGTYYVMYNQWDSYPSLFGVHLVNSIKALLDSPDFEWNIDLIFYHLYNIQFTYRLNSIHQDLSISEQCEQIKRPSFSLYQVWTTKDENEIKPDCKIEWVYVFDLETTTLEILGGYYIPKYNIIDMTEG